MFRKDNEHHFFSPQFVSALANPTQPQYRSFLLIIGLSQESKEKLEIRATIGIQTRKLWILIAINLFQQSFVISIKFLQVEEGRERKTQLHLTCDMILIVILIVICNIR